MKSFCKVLTCAVYGALCITGYSLGWADELSVDLDYKAVRVSAENGDVKSQYLMGYHFYSGLEAAGKDYLSAAKWFRKAADQGRRV